MKSLTRPLESVWPIAALATVLALYSPQAPPEAVTENRAALPAAVRPAPETPDQDTLEDVRPVLLSIAEAMGQSAARSSDARLSITLQDELASDRHAPIAQAAADTDRTLHQTRVADGESQRRLSNVALISALAAAEPVQFAIAIVPDYVDSQSGWLADHVVTGIQAAFSDARYSLDRFHLPDWMPKESGAAATSRRRAHEREPGVLVFRRDEPARHLPRLFIVLLVLETPTAGPHVAALHNAVALVEAWRKAPPVATAGVEGPTLVSVIGPTFSGSLQPLLRIFRERDRRAPLAIAIVNGAANATDNNQALDDFIVSYRQFISDFSDLAVQAQSLLATRGYEPSRMAMLVEETAFGDATFGEAPGGARSNIDWPGVDRFRFPLHVSQLRAAAVGAVALSHLLGQPSVPVEMRDEVSPTDLLPALRPGLVSPTVEVNFRGLLKAIRYEGIRAVGIVATDARDALFLARELRRFAPSVQLVLFGAQALYLHPEYAPFMRGALVASTYPLAPILEPPVGTARTTFAGQEAVGVFRATQYLLRRLENASDGVQGTSLVTDPRDPRVAESHQVWLSVIGSDAFWPLRVAPAPGNTGRRLRATASTWLILLACLLFVGVFIVSAIRALLAPRQSRSSGIATDAGRRDYGVLAAPSGTKWTGVAHAFAVAQAGAVVSVLTFGAVFILLSRVYGETSLATTVIALVAWGLMIILSLVVAFDAVHRVRHDAVPALKDSAKDLVGRCKAGGDANDLRNVAALLLWALLYITTVWAAVALGAWMLNDVTASQPALQTITYKRLLAGGIVSPVSGLLCICCALLVPILWDRNRGTLLADGYQHYEQTSPCFRYLLGAAADEDTNLRSLAFSLDAPLRSLALRRVSFVFVVAIALYVALRWHGFSLDGKAFSQFLWLATFGVLLRALVQLIQAIESWRHLSEALGRIKHEPFIAAAKAVHNKHLAWNVSLFSVRVGHMVPVIRLLQRLAATEWAAQMPDARAAMQIFSDEAARSPKMPAAVSQTWCASWKVVESVLPRVRATLWVPHGAAASAAVTGRPDARFQVTDVELFIALHLAFMLRDMVSRIVCTMGNALTSLGLLVLGHLLYTFQGRSTFLIVDMLFLIAAAATSLWLLVSVERDFVISMLRDTRPGRVEFNATFLRGVAVYVVLPVVAALGAVFPEIGIHFTSVLDPLRQIAGQ